MTALTEYQRLESTGLWREAPGAQRREVVVSLGDATLMISDVRSQRPLAHWSLPAVERRNPGARPAVFVPGPEGGEELELTDDLMIGAIGKVHRLIAARQPHPGRLRRVLLTGALAAVIAGAVLFLPRVMVDHTASVLPLAKRAEIGDAILADMSRSTGYPCAGAEGKAVLGRLADRLLGPGGGRLVVVPQGLDGTRHLPGRITVIGAPLLAGDGPDAVTRALIAETLRAEAADPLIAALRHAGLAATFRLLTTGLMPKGALDGYGRALLTRPQPEVSEASLVGRMQEVGVMTADGAAPSPAPPPVPVVSDNDWVALQGICEG